MKVVDPVTLAFPNYDGNGMFLSMGNIAQQSLVGMLFIDFERQRRLRLSGRARISNDDDLLPCYPEAQFIVRVSVTRVFPQLSPIHPQVPARRALGLRAPCGMRDAGAELEKERVGVRRPS